MAKWLDGLEKSIGGGPGGTKRVKTMRILIIMGCIGAFLMLLNSYLPFQKIEPSTPESGPPVEEIWSQHVTEESPFETIEKPLEARLKEILEKMVGVGSVSVMVTIDSTEEVVVERNIHESESITNENDKNGGTRHITQTTKDGEVILMQVSGGQQPIIVKTIKPKIRGVLIVAQGAENATVRKLIIQAVEKGINVPISRISVMPSKQ